MLNKKGQEVKHIQEDDLKRIREYLKLKNKIVLLSFINIGVNVALRISDLRNLRFEDIIDGRYIEIKETKTKKRRIISLNSAVQKSLKELKAYYKSIGYPNTEGYIFKSLTRYNKKFLIDTPFTNNGVSKEFNKIKDMLNILYPIGSHSLRKTWGYTVYKKTKNIAIIMKALNHSSVEQTLKYIGVEQEDINNLYDEIII